MNRGEVEIFLPCRAGSERVPHKNTRPFAGHANGLIERKLTQLAGVTFADRIVLDSNDPLVLAVGQAERKRWAGRAELIVRERPNDLGRSTTTTDSLINYALSHTAAEFLVWTHVTSPLADTAFYERAWTAFVDGRASSRDSLMAVTPVRGFIWSRTGPMNYDPDPIRWPRTQDIEPLYDVNSALFIVPTAIGRRRGDRIGDKPLLFDTTPTEAVDIDWPDDFDLAELLVERHRNSLVTKI